MAKKRSFGLSVKQTTLDFIDRYATAREISRAEAIEQLVLFGLENIDTISHIEQNVKVSLDKLDNRLKNEVNRLAKLQIHQLKLLATIKAFILFHLDNTLHVDTQIMKTIEEKSIQKIMESLKNGNT